MCRKVAIAFIRARKRAPSACGRARRKRPNRAASGGEVCALAPLVRCNISGRDAPLRLLRHLCARCVECSASSAPAAAEAVAGGEQEQPPRERGASAEAVASAVGYGTKGGPAADEIGTPALEAQVRPGFHTVGASKSRTAARRPATGAAWVAAAAGSGPGRSLGALLSKCSEWTQSGG